MIGDSEIFTVDGAKSFLSSFMLACPGVELKGCEQRSGYDRPIDGIASWASRRVCDFALVNYPNGGYFVIFKPSEGRVAGRVAFPGSLPNARSVST